MTVLEDLQSAVEQAAEQVGPAVVGLGRGWHGGSGVVVAAGSVLTAAHNVRNDELTVIFADGERAAARVANIDSESDLALLAVDTRDIAPIETGSEQPSATVGTPVLAVANPGGRGLRVTLGFVSAVDRSFRGPHGRRITGCLEHSAPLPRGSSGSPIVDATGRLLGLNAIRLEGGLIVAVPADGTRIDALLRGDQPARAHLGVAVAPPYVARRLRRAVGLPEQEGVLVRSVEQDTPAGRAGIVQGDLIVGAAGRSIDGVDALQQALDSLERGATLELTLVRGTEERKVTVSFDQSGSREEVNR
jgi:serine protease Do